MQSGEHDTWKLLVPTKIITLAIYDSVLDSLRALCKQFKHRHTSVGWWRLWTLDSMEDDGCKCRLHCFQMRTSCGCRWRRWRSLTGAWTSWRPFRPTDRCRTWRAARQDTRTRTIYTAEYQDIINSLLDNLSLSSTAQILNYHCFENALYVTSESEDKHRNQHVSQK